LNYVTLLQIVSIGVNKLKNGGIILSARQQLRLDIIVKLEMGVMDRPTAALVLNVSQRTLKRYIHDYRDAGILSCLHGNQGKAPHVKISEDLKDLCMKLMREKYYDFNMLHALDKINQDLDVNIKREVFRNWCHEKGLVKRHRKRRKKPRYYRVRMQQEGLMIQMDGSHHKWFGGFESCLIVVIDDATGEIASAEFFKGETTFGCLKVLKNLVKKKGAFNILYVDKAGVFGGVKRTGFSQVERALGELGTQVIYANSPQAKGRVERLFETLQDRLIPEMRIAGVRTFRQANKFLQQVYLPQLHNPKFSCDPESPISAYRPQSLHQDLDSIFCVKEYRKVGKDHTISFEGTKYMLSNKFEFSIASQRIEIRIADTGKWYAQYGEQKIDLIKVKKLAKSAA